MYILPNVFFMSFINFDPMIATTFPCGCMVLNASAKLF